MLRTVDVDIAAVIVTFNSAHVIGSLLDSLPAAFDGLSNEVVVIDNGSSDRTRDLLAERTECRVIHSTNVGYAASINRGVELLKGARAVLVLNPDVWLAPGSVRVMQKALAQQGVGIVAPQIRGPEGELQPTLRRSPSLLRSVGLGRTGLAALSENYVRATEYLTARPVDWATGAILLVSSECHNACRGWDESYFLQSEEVDFCLRARDLGYRTVYAPGAHAVHIGQQSGYSNAVHAMQVVNRVRFYRRRNNVAASWVYFGLTFSRELVWGIAGRHHSRHAAMTLIRPSRRPREIGASGSLMPS